MQRMGKGEWIFLLIWCVVSQSNCQDLVWADSMALMTLSNGTGSGKSLVKYKLSQEFEYTVTGSNNSYLNWHHDKGVSQIALQQNLKYRWTFENKNHFLIIQNFEHSLGFNIFFDSLSKFQLDDNCLDTRVDFKITSSLTFSFNSRLTTRLFNGYDDQTDTSGEIVRRLSSAFLTPLIWTFSGGIAWKVPRLLSLHLGLTAGKLTYVNEKKIYEQTGMPTFYGVPQENDFLLEYGLSLQLIVEKDFGRWGRWNCDVLIFKEMEKSPDLVLKNMIGIRINKFLKTTIQTRVYYEKAVSDKIQVENIIAIGFYLRL